MSQSQYLKMSLVKFLNIIFVILFKTSFTHSKNEKDNRFEGQDKSNQTIGAQGHGWSHSKESSEKILKGIWLVLGIFLIVALFLLCRFLYKGISVLCLRNQG